MLNPDELFPVPEALERDPAGYLSTALDRIAATLDGPQSTNTYHGRRALEGAKSFAHQAISAASTVYNAAANVDRAADDAIEVCAALSQAGHFATLTAVQQESPLGPLRMSTCSVPLARQVRGMWAYMDGRNERLFVIRAVRFSDTTGGRVDNPRDYDAAGVHSLVLLDPLAGTIFTAAAHEVQLAASFVRAYGPHDRAVVPVPTIPGSNPTVAQIRASGEPSPEGRWVPSFSGNAIVLSSDAHKTRLLYPDRTTSAVVTVDADKVRPSPAGLPAWAPMGQAYGPLI